MVKTRLITGCSSGLGRALAETLLAKGCGIKKVIKGNSERKGEKVWCECENLYQLV